MIARRGGWAFQLRFGELGVDALVPGGLQRSFIDAQRRIDLVHQEHLVGEAPHPIEARRSCARGSHRSRRPSRTIQSLASLA